MPDLSYYTRIDFTKAISAYINIFNAIKGFNEKFHKLY